MSARFTPGPWKVLNFERDEAFEIEGGGCTLALLHYDVGAWTARTESEANAHLIAAAPELYEALETVLVNNRTGATGQRAREGWAKAIAALAKARGEA